ncbi:MAG: hypothetical protein IPM82_01625 [Saprospiraceae bacterium]|nr:hypothetical protein [Saprospiraceae bacterium]
MDTFVGFKEKFKFVTRLHDKNRNKLLRMHHEVGAEEHETLEFVQDSIVYQYGGGRTGKSLLIDQHP